MASIKDLLQQPSVNIKLVTPSLAISRTLLERIYLKIGRQVKTPQEKQAAAAENAMEISSAPKDGALLDSEQGSSSESVWFKSKVVSRAHAEIWLKDGQVYLRDAGSSSGTFLNKMRLSPANKISRPYPLKEGDIIQLGVDYQGRQEDIYQAVEITVNITQNAHNLAQSAQTPIRFKQALNLLLLATNPYATHGETPNAAPIDTSLDCCICISGIGPFQALFIAPCSHCFHYKCISGVLKESLMFPCPVCRQVANLEASVSMESLVDNGNFVEAAKMRRSISSLDDCEMQIDETFSADISGVIDRPQFNIGMVSSAGRGQNLSVITSTYASVVVRGGDQVASATTEEEGRSSLEIPDAANRPVFLEKKNGGRKD